MLRAMLLMHVLAVLFVGIYLALHWLANKGDI